MATYKGKLRQKTGQNTSDILHPETEAGIVTYSNTTSGLQATNVQAAIDEIVQSGVGVTDVKNGSGTSLVSNSVATVTPANIGAQAAFDDGGATIASISNDVVTLKAGVTQTDGAIANSSGNNIVLAKVAKTGAYSDLSGTPTLGTAAAKDYTTSVTSGGTGLPTAGAVYTAISTAIENLPEPMIFKGSVGTGGTVEWTDLPAAAAANEGWTYKVITAHDSAPVCKEGDTIISNGSSWVVIPSGDEPGGTVTSVGLSLPNNIFNVSGSPVTSSGTLTGTLKNQDANKVLAGPTSGSAAAPTFRALTANDIPELSYIPKPQDPERDLGDATTPLYYDGSIEELVTCSQYAGGTKVTLNGTDLGATTATIYAPTNAITTSDAKRYLVGSDSTTSVATENTNTKVYMQNGKLYSNNAEVLTGNQTITLSGDATGSGTTSIAVTLADTGVVVGGDGTATYSAVKVNSKGLVVEGAQFLKVVDNGQTPSDVATGGWFFEKDAA